MTDVARDPSWERRGSGIAGSIPAPLPAPSRTAKNPQRGLGLVASASESLSPCSGDSALATFNLDDLPDRLRSKIKVDANGCWIWTASTKPAGYGQLNLGRSTGRLVMGYAHRVVYELLVGPIPQGLTLDHLCRVRACCNPEHLDPCTHRENILRGDGWSAKNARKTHCPQGHEYTPENIVWDSGGRKCKKCVSARKSAAYFARKARAGSALDSGAGCGTAGMGSDADVIAGGNRDASDLTTLTRGGQT